MLPREGYQAAAATQKLNGHARKYADVVIPPYANMSGNGSKKNL
jgi:hypothetical protein